MLTQCTASPRRDAGKVNMHLPDAYGHVEFAPGEDESNACALPLGQSDEAARAAAAEPQAQAHAAAMILYYAQAAFREASSSSSYVASVDELRDAGLLDEDALAACTATIEARPPTDDGLPAGYLARTAHRDSGMAASVTDSRKVEPF